MNKRVEEMIGKDQPQAQGSTQGRKVTHWTVYVFNTGVIVGVVVAVVSSIFRNYSYTFLGILLTGTNAIGFLKQKDAEVLVRIDQGVKQLDSNLEGVETLMGNLRGVCSERAQTDEELKEWKETAGAIHSSVTQYHEENRQFKDDLEELTSKLEEKNRELAELQRKYESVIHCYNISLEEHRTALSKIGETFKSVDKFQNENDAFKILQERIGENMGKLSQVDASVELKMESLTQIARDIALQIEHFSERRNDSESETELLKKENDRLSQLTKTLNEQMENLNEIEKRLKKEIASLKSTESAAKEVDAFFED